MDTVNVKRRMAKPSIHLNRIYSARVFSAMILCSDGGTSLEGKGGISNSRNNSTWIQSNGHWLLLGDTMLFTLGPTLVAYADNPRDVAIITRFAHCWTMNVYLFFFNYQPGRSLEPRLTTSFIILFRFKQIEGKQPTDEIFAI